jgi:hypothetical protein
MGYDEGQGRTDTLMLIRTSGIASDLFLPCKL